MKQNKDFQKKAIKFVITCIVAGIILYFLGYELGVHAGRNEFDFSFSFLEDVFFNFGYYVAPLLLLVSILFLAITSISHFKKVNALLVNYDEDLDDSTTDIEKHLSYIIFLTGVFVPITFILIASVYANINKIMVANHGNLIAISSIILFCVLLLELALIQGKSVSYLKIINPEKTAEYFDKNFKKNLFNQCDEAEKAKIGASAYRAFNATNMASIIMLIIFIPLSLFNSYAFLPALVVCILMIVNQVAYQTEAKK